MYHYFFENLTLVQILVLGLSAMLIGANKLGCPAIGILPVVLLAIVFPAKISPGIQLILIVVADLLAVAYYRRHANWKIILRVIPFCLVGIVCGFFALRSIDEQHLRPVIGALILGLVVLNLFRARLQAFLADKGLAMAAFFGVMVGFSTHLANAAGPISAMYLLMMHLRKEEYMGVSCWLFLILNWGKMPIFIFEGRVTMEALKMDIAVLPMILVGGALGILFLNKVPQRHFDQFIQVLVFLSAIYLIFAKTINAWLGIFIG